MATPSKKRRYTPRPKRSPSYLTPLSEVLTQTIQQQGLERDFFRWQIFNLWDKIVGNAVAQQAQAVRFQRGILSVCVRNSAWMQELQFMKQEIIDRINREILTLSEAQKEQLPIHFSQVKAIKFYVGKIASPPPKIDDQPPAPNPSQTNPPPSLDQIARAKSQTHDIEDPELRAMLERILIKTANIK